MRILQSNFESRKLSDNPNDTCSIVSLGSIAQEPKLKPFIAQQTDYPFIQWQYLYALEHSGSVGAETGWLPRHLCLMQEGRLLGFLPLYEKNNSAGEYVFDHAWANAYAEHGLRYYPKLVSAIPFSPIQGPRLILADSVDPQWAWRQLFQWLKQFCLQQDSSSWHCLFMSPEQIEQLPSDQIIERKDCHFFWHNRNYRDFEEFLAALSSKKRKNIRRERRSVAESGVIYRIFTDISVADSRNARDSRFIERIGFFNPTARGQEEGLRIDLDRVEYWQSKGAQLSDRVAKLVKEAKAAK